LVVQSGGDGGDPREDRRHFLAVNPGVRKLTSALLFRKRKQKHKDTQSREDRGGDEACRRNLSARLKTRFQVSSEAD